MKIKKTHIHSLTLIITIFFCFFNTSCMLKQNPDIKDGGIIAFSKPANKYYLKGEWKFFWNRFIITENKSDLSNYSFIEAPAIWNNQILSNGTIVPPKGYASYLVEVRLPQKLKQPALFLRDAGTCHRFYYSINGRDFVKGGTAGNPAKSSIKNNPEYKNILIPLPASKNYFFVFEVANYENDTGGLWNVPVLGEFSSLFNSKENRKIRDFIVIGALIIIALYNIFMYFITKEDASSLFLSSICMLMAIRTYNTGLYFQERFPEMSNFEVLFKINYLTMYLGLAVFTAYLTTAFKKYYTPIYRRIVFSVCLLLSIVVIFFKPSIFTQTVLLFWFFITISVLWMMFRLLQAWIKFKDKMALISLLGILFLFAAIINDMLYARQIVLTGFFSTFGFLFFIVLQGIVVALKNKYYNEQIGELTAEIKRIKTNFAKVLNNKTSELQKAIETEKNSSAVKISHQTEEKIMKVVSYINKNFKYDISREGLAAMVDLSPSRMGKYFTACTDKKINDYINELRINYSLKPLRESSDSVIDIAFSAGFESLSTFNRAFKKYIDITPSEYRNKYRKGLNNEN